MLQCYICIYTPRLAFVPYKAANIRFQTNLACHLNYVVNYLSIAKQSWICVQLCIISQCRFNHYCMHQHTYPWLFSPLSKSEARRSPPCTTRHSVKHKINVLTILWVCSITCRRCRLKKSSLLYIWCSNKRIV